MNTKSKQNLEQKLESFNSSQLINWMKWILVIAVLALFIVLGLYWMFFDGEVIADHEKWGTFGDYVGGILNPFFSFLALLALLLTIILQNRQLEISEKELVASRKELELSRTELAKTAEAAKKQAEHFEREAKRIELYRLIEKLAERINLNYSDKNCVQIGGFSLSIHQSMLSSGKEEVTSDYENTGSPIHRTIKSIETDLARLATYIKKYEDANMHIETPIRGFYRDEFSAMIEELRNINIEITEI